MAIQLSDELLAALQAEVDEAGVVSFMGSGVINPETKTLEIQTINDQPVEYAEEAEESSEEEEAEGEGEEMPMKEGAPMGIVAMFKKGAGYDK